MNYCCIYPCCRFNVTNVKIDITLDAPTCRVIPIELMVVQLRRRYATPSTRTTTITGPERGTIGKGVQNSPLAGISIKSTGLPRTEPRVAGEVSWPIFPWLSPLSDCLEEGASVMVDSPASHWVGEEGADRDLGELSAVLA